MAAKSKTSKSKTASPAVASAPVVVVEVAPEVPAPVEVEVAEVAEVESAPAPLKVAIVHPSKPTYKQMVMRAIVASDPLKFQCSRQALSKEIMAHHVIPNEAVFKNRLQKTLHELHTMKAIVFPKGPSGPVKISADFRRTVAYTKLVPATTIKACRVLSLKEKTARAAKKEALAKADVKITKAVEAKAKIAAAAKKISAAKADTPLPKAAVVTFNTAIWEADADSAAKKAGAPKSVKVVKAAKAGKGIAALKSIAKAMNKAVVVDKNMGSTKTKRPMTAGTKK